MYILTPLVENHLEERYAPYIDRHSDYIPSLEKSLEKLPQAYRKIIMMRYMEEMTVAQIARALDISHQAVSQRLKTAMKALKKCAEKSPPRKGDNGNCQHGQ